MPGMSTGDTKSGVRNGHENSRARRVGPGPDARARECSALALYLRDARRCRRLTREEERECACAIRTATDAAEAPGAREIIDVNREKLILGNQRLVVSPRPEAPRSRRARRGSGPGRQHRLMAAVRNFEPNGTAVFSSYAYVWILGAVRRAIARQARSAEIRPSRSASRGRAARPPREDRRNRVGEPIGGAGSMRFPEPCDSREGPAALAQRPSATTTCGRRFARYRIDSGESSCGGTASTATSGPAFGRSATNSTSRPNGFGSFSAPRSTDSDAIPVCNNAKTTSRRAGLRPRRGSGVWPRRRGHPPRSDFPARAGSLRTSAFGRSLFRVSAQRETPVAKSAMAARRSSPAARQSDRSASASETAPRRARRLEEAARQVEGARHPFEKGGGSARRTARRATFGHVERDAPRRHLGIATVDRRQQPLETQRQNPPREGRHIATSRFRERPQVRRARFKPRRGQGIGALGRRSPRCPPDRRP